MKVDNKQWAVSSGQLKQEGSKEYLVSTAFCLFFFVFAAHCPLPTANFSSAFSYSSSRR
jgi:hypothetical protein